jgi:ketosteroid isomerase-like protein/phenylpyruvate tautomerase PptA (4-oxalocrotonate tautomerase family)
MPFVRIDLPSSIPPKDRRRVADGVHEALVAAIGIPADDRFQLVTARAEDEMIFDRGYLGIERVSVVFVEVRLRGGRTPEMKARLYHAIAERLEPIGVRREDVFVTLGENALADWSFGNGEAQYLTTPSAFARPLERTFGPESQNRIAEAGALVTGVEAALETFYYALNRRDRDAMREIWLDDPLVVLANPIGGIVCGREAVSALYDRLFASSVDLQASYSDIVRYGAGDTAVFAGRERATYRSGGERVSIEFRTTRVFAYVTGSGWRQAHHHGSSDDPAALLRYREAVAFGATAPA